ncbi:hypothetical protein [Pseudoalteromonas phenolica]|uniref:hypothetical protein n=1 Tax=Pseudoalteromonas phenolica TaxID=161398 RepID=UPI00384BF6C5
MREFIFIVFFIFLISGCNFDIPEADNKFGMQNFVSAVSMIELHKVRNGEYPTDLEQLEFLGDWDGIWLSSVKYEKLQNGYNLYVERGWTSKPTLHLPVKFKQGLGILDTNVTWVE